MDKDVVTADEARYALFGTLKKPESLPPTTDALRLHLMRSHYQVSVYSLTRRKHLQYCYICPYYEFFFQASVWEKAHEAHPALPDLESCGWKLHNNVAVPVLMNLDPVPKACIEIITCNCKTQCANRMCGCKRSDLTCTKLCYCKGRCLNSCILRDELTEEQE